MSENGKMRIPLEGVIQGPPTAVTIEVRLGLLLPRQVMERLTHATTVGVSAVDLLAKTKLAKGKRQAKQLISAGDVWIDGRQVPPDAREVDVHLGSTIGIGQSTLARLVR
ncbi:MAG: hypothetical protein IIC80_09140 [Chloroflexi bacterium]|nr:hypothetical protein [Chloroflexota bacterium]